MHSKAVRFIFIFCILHVRTGETNDIWMNIGCNERYFPENCDLENFTRLTVEDISRCAPAQLPIFVRNYYLGWSGSGMTYRDNRDAFERIKIKPKMMRDISDNSLEVTTFGRNAAFPIGVSPTALQELAHPGGEIAIASAAAAMNAAMIGGSFSLTRLEDVAEQFQKSSSPLWMELYIYSNISYTIDIIRRAERSGFQALVLTVDSNIVAEAMCNAKESPEIANLRLGNIPETFLNSFPVVITFEDIRWMKSITKLPIIAKGILTGEDAVLSIQAGASAIIVSNQGGRQLDGVPASIDALPEVVATIKRENLKADIYLDGGIRNGFDVYAALARGAKMVFVGRPILWGLTLWGEEGVKSVLNILKNEFNETMLLSGARTPSEISSDTIIPFFPNFG